MSAVGDGGRIGAYPGVRGGGGERDGREGEEEEGGTHRGRGGQANEVRQVSCRLCRYALHSTHIRCGSELAARPDRSQGSEC